LKNQLKDDHFFIGMKDSKDYAPFKRFTRLFSILLAISTLVSGLGVFSMMETPIVSALSQYSVTVKISGQGTTNPKVATYYYSTGTRASYTATPSSGWAFDHWEYSYQGSAVSKSTSNPFSLGSSSIDRALTLVAVFKSTVSTTDTSIATTTTTTSTGTSSGSYAKSLTITIDHNKIGSTLTDFPLLVKLSSTSPVLSELSVDNRKKLSIVQGSQELYVEIESWSLTQAVLWVKVPTISSSVDTILYLRYDKNHAENTARVGDTSDATTPLVWSNGYVGVWHLASSSFLDSSSQRNNGIGGSGISGTINSVRAPSITSGIAGLCASFDGVNDIIRIPDNPYYSVKNNPGNQLSLSFWISPSKINQGSSEWWAPIGKGDYTKVAPYAQHEYKFNIYNDDSSRSQRRSFYMLDKDSGYGSGNYAQPVFNYDGVIPKWTANSWAYMVGQILGNNIYIFNGPGIQGHAPINWSTGEGSQGNVIKLQDTSASFWLGNYGDNASTSGNFAGRFDEVRISRVARSAAWIKADYYSQNGQLMIIS